MKRRVLMPLLLFAVGVLLLLALIDRDPAANWPKYEAFRCQTCNGPASVNPRRAREWGCESCGYTTFRLHSRFRVAVLADFPGTAEYGSAMREAGAMTPLDMYWGSPAQIWSE